jgi:hypothetical protein
VLPILSDFRYAGFVDGTLHVLAEGSLSFWRIRLLSNCVGCALVVGMSSSQAALPFSTQPWELAKARFLQDLSDIDRNRFEGATLENVFYDASVSQKKHAADSKSWIVQEKLTSLVEGIDDYGKALDIYSNAYPLVLCPLWGSIRVVLHVSCPSLSQNIRKERKTVGSMENAYLGILAHQRTFIAYANVVTR